MAKGKKYDYRVVQDDSGWAVEITRQITSRKTVVSKRQDGFASESDAQAWAEKELKVFVQQQSERNKRRDLQREVKPQSEAQPAPASDTASESE